MIWEKEVRELLVRVTGLMRIETLLIALRERYGVAAQAGEPMVIYKERPVKRGRGFVEYTMPKPCWAVMLFDIEPLPTGSGVVFERRPPTTKSSAAIRLRCARLCQRLCVRGRAAGR